MIWEGFDGLGPCSDGLEHVGLNLVYFGADF